MEAASGRSALPCPADGGRARNSPSAKKMVKLAISRIITIASRNSFIIEETWENVVCLSGIKARYVHPFFSDRCVRRSSSPSILVVDDSSMESPRDA